MQSKPEADPATRALVLPRPLRRPLRLFLRWITSGEAYSLRTLAAVSCGAAGIAAIMWVADRGGAVAVLSDFTADAGIRIGEVEVSGGRETTKIDVLTTLDLGPERSLFTFDVHEARETLRQLAWVADAEVAKTYPDTLHVNLVEREAFAVWQRGEELWLVSREGEQIIRFDDRFAHLPLVVGPGANEHAAQMLALVGRYPAVSRRAKAYVRVGRRRWNIVMDNGVTVMLPENEVEASIIRFVRLQEEHDLYERDLQHVDLRFEDRLVLGLTETGVEQVEQAREARAKAASAGG